MIVLINLIHSFILLVYILVLQCMVVGVVCGCCQKVLIPHFKIMVCFVFVQFLGHIKNSF